MISRGDPFLFVNLFVGLQDNNVVDGVVWC